MSEDCCCFFLAIVCFADFWPLRPRVVICTSIWCFGHHFYLKNRFCAMSHRSSDTVISRITSANNDNVFSLCRNVCAIHQFHIICPQCFCRGLQEIDCEINSFCVPSRCFDISWMRSSTAENYTVKLF